ncbi:Panacea domain-containing protein [Levilactobacillus sp. HBUAS70063]|uniref:Panacea domain-containing protein n=1 Tax=Levilactobacillus sp. HBUAS70063 TaxID=3109359 RepID=UPI003132C2E4
MKVKRMVNWLRVQSEAQMGMYGAEELTQWKAMALLYYVQGTYLAMYGVPAFKDEIIIEKNGPVIAAVREKYHDRIRIVGKIGKKAWADDLAIEDRHPQLLDVLHAVWLAYGDMSTIELRQQMLKEKPCQETPVGHAIDLDRLTAFFQTDIVAFPDDPVADPVVDAVHAEPVG